MLKIHKSLILEMQKVFDIGITGFSFITAYCIKQNLLPKGLNNLSTGQNYHKDYGE